MYSNLLKQLDDFDIMTQDKKFVFSKIVNLPTESKDVVLENYIEIFIDTYNGNLKAINPSNIARRKANLWLLGLEL
jgi:hypothetical protein